MKRKFPKIIYFLVCFMLIFQQSGFAQIAGQLDISGYFTGLRNVFISDSFRPLHLRYISYDNLSNNLKLLLDKGDIKSSQTQELENSTKELLRYFFIGISLPNDSFWVNLRPDSPDNIIDSDLAQTDLGKVLLEADLQLKKDTANFTSPQTPEGKDYWNKLYQKANELFGGENITIPTLTRPWIVPGEIIIRETQENAYVYKATLKVMLEQDYLKDSTTYNFTDERSKKLNEYASELIRKTIIPKLTKDINTAKRYAPLRQVYYSLILAHWFKDKFSGKGGLYSQLINKKNLNGLVSKESWSKDTYFQAYQKSFKEGEYNIKEPVYTLQGQTIRNYMSGGIALGYDAIKRAISFGIEILSNSLRPLATLNHQISGNLSPGSIQDPFSGEINIQPQEIIGPPAGYSPVTVEEVNYDSGDNSNRALFIKIHKGPAISTGTWGHSSEVLKTYGAANCIVSLLIDNEGKQGIMGHYPYVVSKYSSKDLNAGFHGYLDVVRGITSVNTRYTLYLFGGSPMNNSKEAIIEAKANRDAVVNAFKDALSMNIGNIIDNTKTDIDEKTDRSKVLDWLIAEKNIEKQWEITYHYTSASSPVESPQDSSSPIGNLKIVASSPLSSPVLGRWAQKAIVGLCIFAMPIFAITDSSVPSSQQNNNFLISSINKGEAGSLERVLMLSINDSLIISKVLPNIDYAGLAAKSAQGEGEALLQFLTLYKYIGEYGSWGKFVSDTIPGYLKSKIRNINVNVFRDKAINGDCPTIEALFILAKDHKNYDAQGILAQVNLDKLIDKANQGDPHAYVIIGMLGDDSYLPVNSNYFSKIDPSMLINRYLSGEINNYFDRAISFYADRYKSGNAKKLAGLLLGEANKGNIEVLNTLVNVVATNLDSEDQSDILGKKINPYWLRGRINAENIDLAVWIFKSLIQNNNTAAMNYLFELSTDYKLAKDLLLGYCNYRVLQLRYAHLDERISSDELERRLIQENMGDNPRFLYLAFSSDEMFGDLGKMIFDRLQNMAHQNKFPDVDSYLKSLDPGNMFYTNFVLQSANFSLLGDMIDSPESLGRITKLMFQDLSSDYMKNISARIALFVEKTVENKDFKYQKYFQESLLNLYRLAKDDFHRKFLAGILSLYKEDLTYLDQDAIRVIERNEGVSYRKDDYQIDYKNLFKNGKLIVNLVYSDEDAMTSSFGRSLNFFSSKGYRVVAKTHDRTTIENAQGTVRIVLIDNSRYDSDYDMDKEVSEGVRIVSGRNHSGNSGKVYKLLGDMGVVATGLKDKYKDVYFVPGQCRGATIMSELKNKYGVAGIIAVNGTGFGELTDHVIWKFAENLASRKYRNIYEVSQATIEELPKADTEDHVFPSNKAGIFGEILNKVTPLSASSPVETTTANYPDTLTPEAAVRFGDEINRTALEDGTIVSTQGLYQIAKEHGGFVLIALSSDQINGIQTSSGYSSDRLTRVRQAFAQNIQLPPILLKPIAADGKIDTADGYTRTTVAKEFKRGLLAYVPADQKNQILKILDSYASASSPVVSINVFAGNSQFIPRGSTEDLKAYLNVCLLVVAMDKDGNRFMAHFLPSGHIQQGGLSNPELVRYYFKSHLEKLLQNMPGNNAKVAIISSTKDDSLNGLLAELEKNGPAPYLITLEGIENFLKERGVDIPSAYKDDKNYMKIVTFDQKGNVRISYLDNNVVKGERVIQLGEVSVSSAASGASSPVELSPHQSQWVERLVSSGMREQEVLDILWNFRSDEDSAWNACQEKIKDIKEEEKKRIEKEKSSIHLVGESLRESIAHQAGVSKGTIITDKVYDDALNYFVEKDESYLGKKASLEEVTIRKRYEIVGEYVSRFTVNSSNLQIFRNNPAVVFMIAGLLLPSIETGEEGSKMHDLFTGLIARDVETQVFKRVLNAQKGSKERMALFNLIFNATGDNFGKLVQRFNEGERILLPILEFCFRSGIHQAYNETASSPVEITLSDGTTKELSGRFLATWEAMDYVQERLKQEFPGEDSAIEEAMKKVGFAGGFVRAFWNETAFSDIDLILPSSKYKERIMQLLQDRIGLGVDEIVTGDNLDNFVNMPDFTLNKAIIFYDGKYKGRISDPSGKAIPDLNQKRLVLTHPGPASMKRVVRAIKILLFNERLQIDPATEKTLLAAYKEFAKGVNENADSGVLGIQMYWGLDAVLSYEKIIEKIELTGSLNQRQRERLEQLKEHYEVNKFIRYMEKAKQSYDAVVLAEPSVYSSSPVEQKVNEIVRQAADLFNANIPSQCVDASKFIADGLEQLGIPYKVLTRHIPHDASKVAEIGDATDSHTMLEVVLNNKVWVIDTQLKQFTLADRNKLKIPEEFVSRHIYQANEYYAAVPVFSDSICAERVVSATLSLNQTSSSPMNETFYNKIPIIIPEVGSLISEGTGFNSLGVWYTEGPSSRFPYGIVTKKLHTTQDARREFANLLEVSLDNPQFVQPVSLDGNSYAMEYLPGFSLQDVLDKKASLPKEISITEDLSSFARKMSRSSPERYIELQSEGVTRRFALHEKINTAIEHSRGSMDREGVRMFTQQILQMSQGKRTENMVFPQDIEPKNIRFTPRGIVMIDAGRVMQHATPIEFIMNYWVPRIMKHIKTSSSPMSLESKFNGQNGWVSKPEYLNWLQETKALIRGKIGSMAPVRVYYYGMGGGRSSVTNGVEQIDIISPLLATDFDQLYSYDYAEAVSLPVFKVGLDRQLRDLGLQDGNVKTEKIGNTFQISFSYEGRQRTVIVTYGKDAKIEFPAELLNGFEVLYSRGMPVVFRDMQSAKKAVLFEQLKKQGGFLVMESIVNTPIDIEGFRRVDMGDTSWAGEARRLDVFEAASSPVTMEQIRNKVADDSQRILVDVLTTPDGKGGRQPRTVWFDYDKRLLITVFGIDNEQFRRQLQVSVLNKTISTSERLKDVINRIIGQPELVFDALNRYIIEVNNLDRLRGESGIATRRQTRINMLNDLRDALVPLVMVSKINGYISTGKVNTRGQIEMKFAPHDLTSVRQALELMPGLDAGIWESASILLIQVEPMEGSSSPIIKDTKGGIDFRSLPITAQPALNAQLSNMPTPRPLVSVNLDESWGQIQNMLKAGIIPSNERIKEYLQTCCEKKDMDQEVDKILACIADILRLQEERVVSTDSSLKEMLALLESNKPANEMQFVLAKIVVPDKELLTIAQ